MTRAHPWSADPEFTGNADLIEACFTLGHLLPHLRTIDPCINRGTWWGDHRPANLVTHDLDPEFGDGVDFRRLPHPAGSFAQAAYDPPYVASGGEETSSIQDHLNRYGRGHGLLGVNMHSPESVQQLINDGLTELNRVVAPPERVTVNGERRLQGGVIVVKCANYVWSGSLWMGCHKTVTHALDLGLECIDELHLVASPGPQPERRQCVHCGVKIMRRSGGRWSDQKRGKDREPDAKFVCDVAGTHAPDLEVSCQEHAATNWSALFVFRKPLPPKPPATPALF